MQFQIIHKQQHKVSLSVQFNGLLSSPKKMNFDIMPKPDSESIVIKTLGVPSPDTDTRGSLSSKLTCSTPTTLFGVYGKHKVW